MMIIKINNFLPELLENDLEKVVTEIPYYYAPNTSYSEDDPFFDHYIELIKNSCTIENGQFTHAVLDEGQVVSNLHGLLYPVLYSAAEKAGIKINAITRIKINLLLRDKTFTMNNYNFPHSDRGHGEKIFIYYLNDSDGDTIIFNEYDDYQTVPKKFTIAERITPKKGTGVFLECARFHASSNPAQTQHRYVINYNFI